MSKIIGIVSNCNDCPNRHYFSGSRYECLKVQGSTLNADSSIPAWCPLTDYAAATPAVHRAAEADRDAIIRTIANARSTSHACDAVRELFKAAKADVAEQEPAAIVRDNPDDYGTMIEATRPLAVGTKLYAAPLALSVSDQIIRKAFRDAGFDVWYVDNHVAAREIVEAILEAAAPLPRASARDQIIKELAASLPRSAEEYQQQICDAIRAAATAQPDERAADEIYVWFSDANHYAGGEQFIRAWTRDAGKVASLREAIGREPAVYRAAAPQADQRMSDAPRTTPYQWRDTGPLETGEPS